MEGKEEEKALRERDQVQADDRERQPADQAAERAVDDQQQHVDVNADDEPYGHQRRRYGAPALHEPGLGAGISCQASELKEWGEGAAGADLKP